ncbi:protein O-mannosyl-transferase TMTC1-like isoform X3 [Vespula squamosa]|uniref:Protein O-mannosyl-transferase TMTC1-like isoform X3 n=1 Tax=Vespula squamosa TaxID=30214 RepID=A0ABD1ZXK8_VESSQ
MKRRAMFHAGDEKYDWKMFISACATLPSEKVKQKVIFTQGEVEYAAMQFGMPCIPYPPSESPFLPHRKEPLTSFGTLHQAIANNDELGVRLLTFCYLAALNCWLLLCPVTLSHDWQMGSVPLVTSLADTRNLATCLFFGGCLVLTYKAFTDFETLNKVAGFSTSDVTAFERHRANCFTSKCFLRNDLAALSLVFQPTTNRIAVDDEVAPISRVVTQESMAYRIICPRRMANKPSVTSSNVHIYSSYRIQRSDHSEGRIMLRRVSVLM